MTVKLADIKDTVRIDSFIASSSSSSFYHKYLWSSVIEKSFGNKYYCLLSENNEKKVNGLLPMVHMKSLIFGNMLVSMPYFNYGGVCAEEDKEKDLLIQESIQLAKRLNAKYIEYRQAGNLNNEYPVKKHKVSMRLALPETPEELWKSFPSKLRSQIKRSQKEEMSVRIGRNDELDNFYRVFSLCMRNLGTPVYPKHFFKNILECFPENTWICSVYVGNLSVASGFLAGSKNRLEIPWAAADSRYNRFSPNMLLYWSCLRFACEKGFTEFDFGRSTVGGGTYKFKEQWGAVPFQLYWYYWLRDGGTVPEVTPRNPKYDLAIALWKKLPVSITRTLGPHIIKNIP